MEVPWPLGPPDGRYLLRAGEATPGGPDAAGGADARGWAHEPGGPDAPGGADARGWAHEPGGPDVPGGTDEPGGPGTPPTHVIVFATLGAPERRRLAPRRGARAAEPRPEPVPVSTGRATVIDVGPGPGGDEIQQWLGQAGEAELEQGLAVLNRALHAFRVVSADPYANEVGRGQLLVARVGYGAGEQVADGLWSEAREIPPANPRQRRTRALMPQARLAAVLGARQAVLASEELVLRARRDLDQHRPREAALQVLVALDAALAELSMDPQAGRLGDRLPELRGQREPVAAAAQAALTGPVSASQQEAVRFTVKRLEAALRARAAMGA